MHFLTKKVAFVVVLLLALTFVLQGLSPHSVEAKLQGLGATERAEIKAKEFAKIKFIEKVREGDYTIEVTKINQIQGGIEAFARVWTEDGKQIGFGPDGTVDVEKFVIINPPILVPDPRGPVVRNEYKKSLGTVVEKRYREDLQAALLQVIADAVRVKKEKSSPEKIVRGKEGHTTTTCMPAAGTGGTTSDGNLSQSGTNVSFGTLVGGAGSGVNNTTAAASAELFAGTTSNGWDTLIRYGFTCDTSSIPDTDTISSATFSLFGNDKAAPDSNLPTANIYTFAPAADGLFVAGDYDSFGSTAQATAITYASWSTSAYNDFTFNGTGISNISKVGISKFGMREATYDVPNTPPNWSSGGDTYLIGKSADTGGTTEDPKLVVESSAAAPAGGVNQINIIL